MVRPLIVGLAGGIASGKSTVASLLARLGARIVDADRIGHEVLCEAAVKQQILDNWGEGVFVAGEVDRGSLARVVFDDSKGQELAKLEEITHPKIRERILDEINKATESGMSVVVLDVPLLFEGDWDDLCDRIVFVDVDEEIRRNRALARGWSEDSWRRREASQLSVAEKKERSSDIVDGSTGVEATFQQLQVLWADWGLKNPSAP